MDAYTEVQRLRSKWILAIPIVFTGLFLYAVIQQVFLGIPFGSKPAGDTALIIVFFCLLGLLITLFSVRLSTRIDTEGIHYRFFPFHRKYRTVAWHSLSDAYIRDYRALYEYGGWGLKGHRNDNCITISGRKGLQLISKMGGKTLLGISNPVAVEAALKQYNPAYRPG